MEMRRMLARKRRERFEMQMKTGSRQMQMKTESRQMQLETRRQPDSRQNCFVLHMTSSSMRY
jgi:hypothetical protein